MNEITQVLHAIGLGEGGCGVVYMANQDDFNAIDPAVAQDAEGGLWLTFGSFWSGIKLIQLDPATGKRLDPHSRIYSLAHFDSIEASYICRHGSYFYLFVNWGICCRGVSSTYNIRVGRSDRITGPYTDKNGVDLMAGGGSLVLDSAEPFIGPGHAGIISAEGKEWFSCHFYDGTWRGAPALAILPLHWETNNWPDIGPNPSK